MKLCKKKFFTGKKLKNKLMHILQVVEEENIIVIFALLHLQQFRPVLNSPRHSLKICLKG